MFHLSTPYKHVKALDTAFIPYVVEYNGNVFATLYGVWYNINYDQEIGKDQITIYNKDFHNWKEWKKDGTT